MKEIDQLYIKKKQKLLKAFTDLNYLYTLRKQIYNRSNNKFNKTSGYGIIELNLLKWTIHRGVLQDPFGKHPGSPWWRAVIYQVCLDSEIAQSLLPSEIKVKPLNHEVILWTTYFREPSISNWYRAFNTSIIRGYINNVHLAWNEQPAERHLMNELLYRLIFSEAITINITSRSQNPLSLIKKLINIPSTYPCHYPLSATEARKIEHRGIGPEKELLNLLDEHLELPHLTDLYTFVAKTKNHQSNKPKLTHLIKTGRLIYPSIEPERNQELQKIAILGGGISSLATAWELTNNPHWATKYEITIYQTGWRLGGKCATGRGIYNRLEEHGIHVFQGWYDNSFRMIQGVYAEISQNKLAPKSPFPTWSSAFLRNNATIMTEYSAPKNTWTAWPLLFPENSISPGTEPLPMWELIKKMIGLGLELLLTSPHAQHIPPGTKWLLHFFFPESNLIVSHHPKPWYQQVLEQAETICEEGSELFMIIAKDLSGIQKKRQKVWWVKPLIKELQVIIKKLSVNIEQNPEDSHKLRIIIMLDLISVILTGIMKDIWIPSKEKFNFSAINHLDFCAWLRSHGASDHVLDSSFIRFFYTGTFADQETGPTGRGLIAAGTALKMSIKAMGYKGSLVWQFSAGTGDSLIMPLYQVLKHRGVKFLFFHEVLSINPGRDNHITSIKIAEQIKLKKPSLGYDPVVEIKFQKSGRKNKKIQSWPNQPKLDLVNPSWAKKLKNVNLEDPKIIWKDYKIKSLQYQKDFDKIILGIPVKSLNLCCKEIVKTNRRWKNMINQIQTTATASMQLWMRQDERKLGYISKEWGFSNNRAAANTVVYQEPFTSWLNQSQVLNTENWPKKSKPLLTAYFTGSITPKKEKEFSSKTHQQKMNLFKIEAKKWLTRYMGLFWPHWLDSGKPQWKWLCAPPDNTTDEQKYSSQYFRVNINPTDQYTLSVPNSAKYRLRTDNSGYWNLLLCGDWIDYGDNAGFVEGAIISGLLAAHALQRQQGIEPKTSILTHKEIF